MRDIYSFANHMNQYSDVTSQKILEGSIENPEITVFIPTYKRAETLKATVESVLNQQCNVNYEIVVVNNDPNGVADESRDLLESYHSERIYYYVNEKNIGLCGNWNRGIELARAEYVAMIHDDDILGPYFLDAMITAIKENDRPGILGVGYYSFTTKSFPVFQKPQHLSYRNVTKRHFFFGKNINIAGMTVKKDLFMEIGGYAEEYYPNEDTNLIYQFIIKDRVVNVEHPLVGYRKEVNLSLSEGTMHKIICIMEETRRNIAEHEDFAHRWMRNFDKEYLYEYILSANQYWGLNLDYKEFFRRYGFTEKKPGRLKMMLMGFIQSLAVRIG